jgi:uncharacterized coiled-coil protein SlyX
MSELNYLQKTLKDKDILIEHLEKKNAISDKYIDYLQDVVDNQKIKTEEYIVYLEKELKNNKELSMNYINSLRDKMSILGSKIDKIEEQLEIYKNKHLQLIIDHDLLMLKNK